MKLSQLALCFALLPVSICQAAPVQAKKLVEDPASQPIAAPKENRIVKYTYSPDVIFRIFTVTNLHTHIALGDDEGLIEPPMIGDSLQWRLSGGPKNLYIKPLREGIETSMTVVTNVRTYQFQLIAGQKNAGMFQKVSFDYPDRDAQIKLRKETEVAAVTAEQDRLSKQIVTPNVDPASLNFGFDITGDAPFKPVSVYSDGKFTYLRMPNVQDTPAVLLIDDDGKPSLIEYRIMENLIVVERVVKRLLLKLGTAEVRISEHGLAKKKSW